MGLFSHELGFSPLAFDFVMNQNSPSETKIRNSELKNSKVLEPEKVSSAIGISHANVGLHMQLELYRQSGSFQTWHFGCKSKIWQAARRAKHLLAQALPKGKGSQPWDLSFGLGALQGTGAPPHLLLLRQQCLCSKYLSGGD